jgi:hypothetical protein
MIYQGSPARQLSGLTSLIQAKLRLNRRCLYLNSPAMVAGIRSYLAAAGVDVAEEIRRGALVLSSSQDHLIEGRFDPDAMLALLADAVAESRRDGFAGLWATGDMTWELGGEDNLPKLLEYECGLERLFRETPHLCGICQYHEEMFPPDAIHAAVRTHRGVFVSETLSRLNPYFLEPEALEYGVPAQTAGQVDAMLRHLRGAILEGGGAS